MTVCVVCGSPEHPSWKAHVFVGVSTRLSRVVKANGENDQPLIPVAAKAVGVDRPERRPKALGGRISGWPSREAYNAYQREYMRKRRAATRRPIR